MFLLALKPARTFFVTGDDHQKYLLLKGTGFVQELQAIYPHPADYVVSTDATRINCFLGCNGDRGQLSGELDQIGLSENDTGAIGVACFLILRAFHRVPQAS
jgi:hypothetical protein